jgi:hypothetical protein
MNIKTLLSGISRISPENERLQIEQKRSANASAILYIESSYLDGGMVIIFKLRNIFPK